MRLQKDHEVSKRDTQHYKKKVDTLKEEAPKHEASLEEQVVVHDQPRGQGKTGDQAGDQEN